MLTICQAALLKSSSSVKFHLITKQDVVMGFKLYESYTFLSGQLLTKTTKYIPCFLLSCPLSFFIGKVYSFNKHNKKKSNFCATIWLFTIWSIGHKQDRETNRSSNTFIVFICDKFQIIRCDLNQLVLFLQYFCCVVKFLKIFLKTLTVLSPSRGRKWFYFAPEVTLSKRKRAGLCGKTRLNEAIT